MLVRLPNLLVVELKGDEQYVWTDVRESIFGTVAGPLNYARDLRNLLKSCLPSLPTLPKALQNILRETAESDSGQWDVDVVLTSLQACM